MVGRTVPITDEYVSYERLRPNALVFTDSIPLGRVTAHIGRKNPQYFFCFENPVSCPAF